MDRRFELIVSHITYLFHFYYLCFLTRRSLLIVININDVFRKIQIVSMQILITISTLTLYIIKTFCLICIDSTITFPLKLNIKTFSCTGMLALYFIQYIHKSLQSILWPVRLIVYIHLLQDKHKSSKIRINLLRIAFIF